MTNRAGMVCEATDYAGYYIRDAIIEIEDAMRATSAPAVLSKLEQCKLVLETVLDDLDRLGAA